MNGKKRSVSNILIVLAVIVLAGSPLLIAKGAEFGGADDAAEAAILEIRPDYHPWAASILEPASGEIESLLFALQAALGAGVVFFGVGYYTGRARKEAVGQTADVRR